MSGAVELGSNGVGIQAFVLTTNKVNITTGTFTGIKVVHCVLDGQITVTWPDNATDAIALTAGQDFSISTHTQIVVDSGTVHLM